METFYKIECENPHILEGMGICEHIFHISYISNTLKKLKQFEVIPHIDDLVNELMAQGLIVIRIQTVPIIIKTFQDRLLIDITDAPKNFNKFNYSINKISVGRRVFIYFKRVSNKVKCYCENRVMFEVEDRPYTMAEVTTLIEKAKVRNKEKSNDNLAKKSPFIAALINKFEKYGAHLTHDRSIGKLVTFDFTHIDISFGVMNGQLVSRFNGRYNFINLGELISPDFDPAATIEEIVSYHKKFEKMLEQLRNGSNVSST